MQTRNFTPVFQKGSNEKYKVLGVNSYVCRNYRGKTGRGAFFLPPILNGVKVAINDFTMHLIISKWLRRQKSKQKTKTMRQKDVEAKEEIAYESVFIYLKRNRS